MTDALTDPATHVDAWAWGLAATLVVVIVLGATATALMARARRRDHAERDALRADVAALSEQLSSLETPVGEPEFVITRLGDPVGSPDAPEPPAAVRTTGVGEPLVKAIALGHGVRRALAPETRNRIRFEVRREVKRARKSRRREMRDAWREMRTRPVPAEEPGRDVA